MIFKQKIPCYVLIFEQTEIIERTLHFLSSYVSDIEIIVIENPSKNTPKIKKMMDKMGKSGLIKKHYLLDKNVTGNAFSLIIEKEADYIKQRKYVMITDGDIDSQDKTWLKEQKNILKKHRDVFACGISLSTSNLPLKTFSDAKSWIPADMNETKDYFEAFTGIHLLLMRSKELLAFMSWKAQHNLPFVDGNMHGFCYNELHKKWARTKNATALHLTWDLYQDKNHPYTKFKLAKSFKKMWYHQDTADYSLTEY